MSNFISLAQAVTMTQTFRTNQELILAPAFTGKEILPICETFERTSFDTLLGETDASFIRIYLGMDADFKVRIIAVAADSMANDILPKTKSSNTAAVSVSAGDDGNIVEDGMRCPDICPPPSPLNE